MIDYLEQESGQADALEEQRRRLAAALTSATAGEGNQPGHLVVQLARDVAWDFPASLDIGVAIVTVLPAVGVEHLARHLAESCGATHLLMDGVWDVLDVLFALCHVFCSFHFPARGGKKEGGIIATLTHALWMGYNYDAALCCVSGGKTCRPCPGSPASPAYAILSVEASGRRRAVLAVCICLGPRFPGGLALLLSWL